MSNPLLYLQRANTPRVLEDRGTQDSVLTQRRVLVKETDSGTPDGATPEDNFGTPEDL